MQERVHQLRRGGHHPPGAGALLLLQLPRAPAAAAGEYGDVLLLGAPLSCGQLLAPPLPATDVHPLHAWPNFRVGARCQGVLAVRL